VVGWRKMKKDNPPKTKNEKNNPNNIFSLHIK